MKRIIFALASILICGPAWANSCPSYTYTFSNGATADANQVNANFNTIMNCASFFVGGTTTGSAAAQVLASVSPGVFTLTSGNRVTFIAGFTTTGATTLNIASTGATNVYKKVSSGLVPLVAGDMVANQVYTAQYDGTQYELLDPIASNGGLVLLGRASASNSASIQIKSGGDINYGLSSAYEEYEIHFVNVVPATNGAILELNMSTNGGSSYDTGSSSYAFYLQGRYSLGGAGLGDGTGSSAIGYIGFTDSTVAGINSTASQGGLSGTLTIYNPSSLTWKQVRAHVVASTIGGGAGYFAEYDMGGQYVASTSAVNAIEFLMSSSNIASGDFILYGIQKQ